jgi:hypothetical protein
MCCLAPERIHEKVLLNTLCAVKATFARSCLGWGIREKMLRGKFDISGLFQDDISSRRKDFGCADIFHPYVLLELLWQKLTVLDVV